MDISLNSGGLMVITNLDRSSRRAQHKNGIRDKLMCKINTYIHVSVSDAK